MTLEDIKVGMKVTYRGEVWAVKGMEAKYTFAQVHAYLADKSLYTDVVLTRKLAGKKEESRAKAHCLSPAPITPLRVKESTMRPRETAFAYKEVELGELSEEEKVCPESTGDAAYKCLKIMNDKTGQAQSSQDLPKIMNSWGWYPKGGKEFVVDSIAPLFCKTGYLFTDGYVREVERGVNRNENTCALWRANLSVTPLEDRVPDRLSKILKLDKEYRFFEEDEKEWFEKRKELRKQSPKFTKKELLEDARALQPEGIFGYNVAEAGEPDEQGIRNGGDFGIKGGVLEYNHCFDAALESDSHRGDGIFLPSECNHAAGYWNKNSGTFNIRLVRKDKAVGDKCNGTFVMTARKHKHLDGREFSILANEGTIDLIEANLRCRDILTKRLTKIQAAFRQRCDTESTDKGTKTL